MSRQLFTERPERPWISGGEQSVSGIEDDVTLDSVVGAVRAFESSEQRFSADACRRNAARFSPARFHAELRAFVDARAADWLRSRGAR